MSSAADLRARQRRAAALLALALVLPVVLVLVDVVGHRHRPSAAGPGEPPWWPAAFGAAGAVVAAALMWRRRRQPWRWRFTVLVGPVAAGVPALFHPGGAGPDDGPVVGFIAANAPLLAGALAGAAGLLAVAAERLVAGAPTEELVRHGITAAVPLRGSRGALWLAADALVLDPDAARVVGLLERRWRAARRAVVEPQAGADEVRYLAARRKLAGRDWARSGRVLHGAAGSRRILPRPGRDRRVSTDRAAGRAVLRRTAPPARRPRRDRAAPVARAAAAGPPRRRVAPAGRDPARLRPRRSRPLPLPRSTLRTWAFQHRRGSSSPWSRCCSARRC